MNKSCIHLYFCLSLGLDYQIVNMVEPTFFLCNDQWGNTNFVLDGEEWWSNSWGSDCPEDLCFDRNPSKLVGAVTRRVRRNCSYKVHQLLFEVPEENVELRQRILEVARDVAGDGPKTAGPVPMWDSDCRKRAQEFLFWCHNSYPSDFYMHAGTAHSWDWSSSSEDDSDEPVTSWGYQQRRSKGVNPKFPHGKPSLRVSAVLDSLDLLFGPEGHYRCPNYEKYVRPLRARDSTEGRALERFQRYATLYERVCYIGAQKAMLFEDGKAPLPREDGSKPLVEVTHDGFLVEIDERAKVTFGQSHEFNWEVYDVAPLFD